jgi:hypothetical protein
MSRKFLYGYYDLKDEMVPIHFDNKNSKTNEAINCVNNTYSDEIINSEIETINSTLQEQSNHSLLNGQYYLQSNNNETNYNKKFKFEAKARLSLRFMADYRFIFYFNFFVFLISIFFGFSSMKSVFVASTLFILFNLYNN